MEGNLITNSGVYKITNLINNKFYVGSSINLKQRKHAHFYSLKLGKHKSPYLQNAFNKYGIENFVFEVIKYCEPVKIHYYL